MGDKLEIGSSLGHYRIVSKIGSGGMGEVYLAEDSRLRRKIALKVLPEDLAKDGDRLRRFEQEAFAASGLNHPNILTIYEFGTTNKTHFLAAEFVAGETLREHLRSERLPIDEALDIAIQTAAALSAAHEAKIIHRDIKPENIMIRHDHLVKVLDFGLAKLAEKSVLGLDAEAETRAQVRTEPGMIMGTAAYMSPEQARGKMTDARSDIWSLGVVVYEMIAGGTPFAGETTADCIAAIIHKNPASLSLLNKEVPARLEEIIGKCLEKDTDERYQTTKDLLIDLRRVKRKLEFEAEKERSDASEFVKEQTENTSEIGSESKTQIIYKTTDATEAKTHMISSAEYVAGEIKRHKIFAFGVLALLIIAGIGFAVYEYSPFSAPSATASRFTSPQNLKFTRLTSGQIRDIKISPDGKYAAYATSLGDKASIRLRQIATTTDVEIVAPAAGFAQGMSFTADGDYLYYVHYDTPVGDQSAIYRIPTLGGSPTRVADQLRYVDTAVSPDGKTLAYIGLDLGKKESYLLLANTDGSDERTLFKLNDPSNLGQGLAWTPDGKTIAYCMTSFAQGVRNLKIFGVNVTDSSQRLLSDQNWNDVRSIVYLADGNLIISGKEESTGAAAEKNQLWLIAPNAAPQRITNDLNGYGSVSATAKGDVLLATTAKRIGNLWVAPNNDAVRAAQVPSSTEVLLVNWTPDGKLLYTSRANDIWTMNADGTNQKQLTNNQGANIRPSMTADGRYIVFMSNRASSVFHIFRMDVDGRNQKQLTNGLGEWWANPSPDGKWIYYVAFTLNNEPSNICKIPIDGGEPIVIAKVPGDLPPFDISPRDGMIAYRQAGKGQERTAGKISIIPPDGGDPLKTITMPPTAAGFFRWTPDGRAIAFQDSRAGGANIWAVSLDGKGEAKPLTDFKTESMDFSFAWSPDGKQLAVIRGTRITDAVLITETK